MSEIMFQCGECDRELDAQIGRYGDAVIIEPCDKCKEAAEAEAKEEAEDEAQKEYAHGFEDGKLEGENHVKED